MSVSMISPSTKTCQICKRSTRESEEDTIHFGEWMTRNDITVHYYCLLLSTNLPQSGADNAGILGFLIRDIRREAKMAECRKCIYCSETSASIMCFVCKGYFHITCGFTCYALSQFCDQFVSYCHKCVPSDEFVEKFERECVLPGKTFKCYICMESMGYFERTKWIYAKCCGNGFVHSRCMKIYALQAGYYLNCIWCKNKQFREDVKYLGIFVPDRDANWEKEKDAYRDLHRGHQRCDMEVCHCPKGRDYVNGMSEVIKIAHRWTIIKCKLCGSFCAHNPTCIPGMENEKEKIKEFKCETCSITEKTISSQSFIEQQINDEDDLTGINTTLFIHKDVKPSHLSQETCILEFTEGDESVSSMETVINKNLVHTATSRCDGKKTHNANVNDNYQTQLNEMMDTENVRSANKCDGKKTHNAIVNDNYQTQLNEMMDTENVGSDNGTDTHEFLDLSKSDSNNITNRLDPNVINRLVKRMLDLFEA